ncbi:MAG: hypothetical protein IPP14_14330 [Planctomycetes bacterium]|nr:hypothetical protein [Planctomycetota bacterium]
MSSKRFGAKPKKNKEKSDKDRPAGAAPTKPPKATFKGPTSGPRAHFQRRTSGG